MQKSFFLELDRCTGCRACEIACQIENELEGDIRWRQVLTFNEQRLPGIPQFHLSLACNHCVDAPCEKSCPALAYDKDPVTGAVTIDAERCIGCKYCLWACPYDAPQFNGSAGTMEKCTFCSHRLRENLEPACTTGCPTGALRFGDYPYATGEEPEAVFGFYRENIEPAISITPLRRMAPPETLLPAATSDNTDSEEREKKVSLRTEWSLLVFTALAPVLVALVASALVNGPWVKPIPFAAIGLFAMVQSALHLGRWDRAYRAVLNWRRSWLSREVLLFPVFVASATLGLSLLPGVRWVAGLAAVMGAATLFAMDQVYRLDTNPRRHELHSAGVLLTGAYFAALLAMPAWVAMTLGGWKLVLYLRRRLSRTGGWWPGRPLGFVSRIFFGFAVPLTVYLLTGVAHYPIILGSILLGETLDRAEFYLELDFIRPTLPVRPDDNAWARAPAVG